VGAAALLAGFLAAPAGAQPTGGGIAAILPLQGEITDVTAQSIKRRIDAATRQGAKTIILDMDTPGGLVTSSIAIADLMRNLSDVKTVAWVNPDAMSGGSLVAVACDEIVMARSSRMGDSQVIMGDLTGVQAVPEELQPKAYSPVLHDFRISARQNGYSEVLAEAFVIPEREVWWLENIHDGKREFVFKEDKENRLKESEHAPKEDAPKPALEWKLVEEYYDELLKTKVPVRQPIDRDDQLLVLSPGEAIAYGFCKGIVSDESDLRTRYSLAQIIRLQPSWSESLAHWLTSIYVRGFLLVVLFLAAYVEFHTPGVGLAGLVALIALAIFVGAPYVTGLANVWEVALILVGLVLIALELFVIPGFGLAGISGVMMILTGLVATFIPDEPGRPFPSLFPALPTTLYGLRVAVITLVSSMVASLLGMLMLSRFLPRAPLFNKLIPANPTPSQVLTEDPYRGAARVGDLGLAEGMLRPAGKARFGAILVDVVTQGEIVEASAAIEVIERRGNRVVVRAVRT
jgi:membrane-bound serine protease (ClpP class)